MFALCTKTSLTKWFNSFYVYCQRMNVCWASLISFNGFGCFATLILTFLVFSVHVLTFNVLVCWFSFPKGLKRTEYFHAEFCIKILHTIFLCNIFTIPLTKSCSNLINVGRTWIPLRCYWRGKVEASVIKVQLVRLHLTAAKCCQYCTELAGKKLCIKNFKPVITVISVI